MSHTPTTYNGVSGVDPDGDGTLHMAIDPPATHGSRDYMLALSFMRHIGASRIEFHTDAETQALAYHDAYLTRTLS